MASKSSKKKAAAGTEAKVSLGGLPKLTLHMPLDARKVAAIRKCLEKGTLSITLNKVDLASGRLGDGWLYD